MRPRFAIALIILQQLCFTLETSAIHYVGAGLSMMQLSLIRAFGGLLITLFMLPSVGWTAFKTPQPKLQVLRAVITIGYSFVMMYSLTMMPLGDATAISYTQAIYMVLFAPLILGETVGMLRWSAVLIGLVGAVLLINPSFSHQSLIYLAVLLATSLNALAVVLTKYMQRKDHPVTVMLYVSAMCSLFFSSSLFIDPWPHLSLWQCLWLLPVLLVGPFGMYIGIVAVRYADASTLAPYTYTRLLAISAISPIFFGESISTSTIVGATIIVLACVLASAKDINLGFARLRAT